MQWEVDEQVGELGHPEEPSVCILIVPVHYRSDYRTRVKNCWLRDHHVRLILILCRWLFQLRYELWHTALFLIRWFRLQEHWVWLVAIIFLTAVKGELHHWQQLFAGVATWLQSVRLSQLGQGRVKVNFVLLALQLGELFRKVFVHELLHVALVVPRNFLSFDSTIEQISVEFAHHTEAGTHKIATLLHKFWVLTW